MRAGLLFLVPLAGVFLALVVEHVLTRKGPR
jgi:hypothetical protein